MVTHNRKISGKYWKRHLLATAALPLLASVAMAGEIDLNGTINVIQSNSVGQFAELDAEYDFEMDEDLQTIGDSLTATTTAIGNSAALNMELETSGVSFDIDQANIGDYQEAETDIDELDLSSGTDLGLDVTTAAFGNAISGQGTGTILELNIDQDNDSGHQWADNEVDDVAISGLENSFTAAAIGNSVSLTAGSVGTGELESDVYQHNHANQDAENEIDEIAVRPTVDGASYEVSTVAIANSFALTAEVGDIYLDSLDQDNFGTQDAQTDFEEVGHTHWSSTLSPLGSNRTYEPFDASIVSAAIGNTGSLTAEGHLLVGEVEQVNESDWGQGAESDLDEVDGLDDLSVTAVAYGNTFSATAGGNAEIGLINGVTQANLVSGSDQSEDDLAQFAESELDNLQGVGALAVTTAAVGNAVSIDAEGSLALGDVTQANGYSEGDSDEGQYALTHPWNLTGFSEMSISTVAIGNTFSATAVGELSFGIEGSASVSQVNMIEQSAETFAGFLDDFGDVEITTAAIGNSFSLTGGSFSGTDTLSLAQTNSVGQYAGTYVGGNELGGFNATTAAIGNTTSITIK